MLFQASQVRTIIRFPEGDMPTSLRALVAKATDKNIAASNLASAKAVLKAKQLVAKATPGVMFLRKRIALEKHADHIHIEMAARTGAINTLNRFSNLILQNKMSGNGLSYNLAEMIKRAMDMRGGSSALALTIKECSQKDFGELEQKLNDMVLRYEELAPQYVDQVASLIHLQHEAPIVGKKVYQTGYWRQDKVVQLLVKGGMDKEFCKYLGMYMVASIDQLEDALSRRKKPTLHLVIEVRVRRALWYDAFFHHRCGLGFARTDASVRPHSAPTRKSIRARNICGF